MNQQDQDKPLIPPFYPGQKVVAVDALPKSKFKNGKIYTVRCCHWSINPANGLGPFCYIGIDGLEGDWYRAAIFTPVEKMKFPLITLEKIRDIEKTKVLCEN